MALCSLKTKAVHLLKRKSSGEAGCPVSPLHLAECRESPNVRAGAIWPPGPTGVATAATTTSSLPSSVRVWRSRLALVGVRWHLPGGLAALWTTAAPPLWWRCWGRSRRGASTCICPLRGGGGGGGGLTRWWTGETGEARKAPVGWQGLQELWRWAEAHLFLALGQQWCQSAAPLAARLTAQLVVAGDGAVAGQDLHLAEDGLIPCTRLICPTKDTKTVSVSSLLSH